MSDSPPLDRAIIFISLAKARADAPYPVGGDEAAIRRYTYNRGWYDGARHLIAILAGEEEAPAHE